MLACLLKGPNAIILEDMPIPTLKPGDVLVKMKACGICGTDLEKIRGELDPYGILGHEPSGVVDKVGPDVRGIQPGDRVVAHHHVPCYHCNYCAKADYTMCEQFKRTNLDPCGFAEYFRLSEVNVSRGAILRIPEEVSYEEGALIEPTACCIRAVNKLTIGPRDNIVVLGLGPTGLTQIQLLRLVTDGKIIGLDLLEVRRRAASRFGSDEEFDPGSPDAVDSILKSTHGGADISIVSTGNEKAVATGLKLLRKGGRLLLFGAPPRDTHLPLHLASTFGNQINILTSYSCLESEMRQAIDLTAAGKVDLKSLITHRFNLPHVIEGFESALTSSNSLKTIIVD